jgi:hypothetical protein
MQNRTPVICDQCRATGERGGPNFTALAPDTGFTPVPRKPRSDGWTPERQRAFVEALAATGSVKHAAKAVNMSPVGAYYLRRQKGAEEFRAAWDAALAAGAELIETAALERAVHGVAVPIYHNGKQVGEKRVHNERLTMFLLQHNRPTKYGYAKRGTAYADEQERAEEIRADILANHDAWIDHLARLYHGRILLERRKRLEGEIIAADFYVRQATHMEVLLELGGGGKHLLAMANGAFGPGMAEEYEEKHVYSTAVSRQLDALRREAWAEAGEPPRPALTGNTYVLPNYVRGGPDFNAREAALADAKRRAALAQAMWEQALQDQIAARDPDFVEDPTEPSSLFCPRTADHDGLDEEGS